MVFSLIFADFDECLTDDHKCSHTCHNTPGSYYCDCPPGYRLDPDETGQCRGKIQVFWFHFVNKVDRRRTKLLSFP